MGAGVFAERIQDGRTGIVLRQGLLDSGPPGGRVGSEGDTPAPGRPRGRCAFHRAAPCDLVPGRPVFKACDNNLLDHVEEIVPIAEEETGEERERAATRLTQPPLDPHPVRLRRAERLARVEPVADEERDGVAVQTHFGTGKVELPEMIQVLDKGAKLGYNDHGWSPTRRKLPSCVPSGRAIPFSRIAHSIHDSQRKTKAALHGRPGGW